LTSNSQLIINTSLDLVYLSLNDAAQQQPEGEGKFDVKFWQHESYEYPGQQFYYCTPAFVTADETASVGDDLLTAGSDERVLN